jgi:hypothetical protein
MPDYPTSPEIMAEINAKLSKPWDRTPDGYTRDGGYRRPIWSPAGFLARKDRYVIVCGCGSRRDAPLAEVERAGLGDRPLHTLKWKACEACGGSEFRFEVIDGPRIERGGNDLG